MPTLTSPFATISTATAALLISVSAGLAIEAETPSTPEATSAQCVDGQMWDAASQACVDAKESRLNDDDRFDAARSLAYAGRFDAALTILAAADNPRDPRILNYQGFANRKAGRADIAMTYYRAALDIDPDYVLARSYMGQALVDQGDIAGAEAELAEIRARSGRDSWAYVSLKQALQGKSGY